MIDEQANSSEMLGMCLDCLSDIPIGWVVQYIAETARMPDEARCPRCGGEVGVPHRPVYEADTGRILGGWLGGHWFDAYEEKGATKS